MHVQQPPHPPVSPPSPTPHPRACTALTTRRTPWLCLPHSRASAATTPRTSSSDKPYARRRSGSAVSRPLPRAPSARSNLSGKLEAFLVTAALALLALSTAAVAVAVVPAEPEEFSSDGPKFLVVLSAVCRTATKRAATCTYKRTFMF